MASRRGARAASPASWVATTTVAPRCRARVSSRHTPCPLERRRRSSPASIVTARPDASAGTRTRADQRPGARAGRPLSHFSFGRSATKATPFIPLGAVAPGGTDRSRGGSRSRISVPPPGAASALDRAAVGLGDLLDDREAEPRAGHAPRRGRAVEALEDVRQVLARRSRGRGRARSARRRRASPRPARRRGLHLAALSSRFAIARSRLAGVPTIVDGVELGVDRHLRMVARRPPDRVLGDEVEPDVLERGRPAPRRGRARSAR